MATRSEALKGNQNAAGPRGVKGIGAKVGDAAKSGLAKIKSGLSTASSTASSKFKDISAAAKPIAVNAAASVKRAGRNATSTGIMLGAMATPAINRGIQKVKDATPAGKRRVAAQKSAAMKSSFIRSERLASNAADAAKPSQRLKQAVAGASIKAKAVGESLKGGLTSPAAMKLGDASRDAQDAVKRAVSSRAKSAGSAVKRFVKKTYTSGG